MVSSWGGGGQQSPIFYLLYPFSCLLSRVVEPFHFGPAPAPASQDGGSGSSSSPVVNNLLLKKKLKKILLLNLPGLVLFKEKKGTSALLCSSSTLFNNFVYFFSLKFKQRVRAGD